MAIIVSRNGQPGVRVEASAFGAESDLQEYLAANPDCLPLDDLEPDLKLAVIGREFPTDSGPVDVLAIDSMGVLYVIETKLYKNQDKRRIVAQVLDYGAAIWAAAGREQLESQINEFLANAKRSGLHELVQTTYGLSEEDAEQVIERMHASIASGRIRFVVLMDQLHERLKDLLRFLNANGHFEVFAVEIEHYLHEDTQIVIPKLFGAEAPRPTKSLSRWTRERILTDSRVLALPSDHRSLLEWLLRVSDELEQEGLAKVSFGTGNKPNAGMRTDKSRVIGFGLAKSLKELTVQLRMDLWDGDPAAIAQALSPLSQALNVELAFDPASRVSIVDELLKPTVDRQNVQRALRLLVQAL